MTTPQILSFAVIGAMMAAFIWGRFRYDVVAAVALLAAVAVGVVPFEKAFTGFADDIVIIVGSALVVSAAVSRSGIMEFALQRFAPNLVAPRLQLIILVTAVAVLSAFVKNIGALAIMIPIAFQFARRSNVSPSMFLMPMSFASLLGGLITQIGTSPNIIVSRVREDLTGHSFSMFDFTPVGLVLTVAGIVFLALFYWLLPDRRREGLAVEEVIEIKNYTTEATRHRNVAAARQDGKRSAEARRRPRHGHRRSSPPTRSIAAFRFPMPPSSSAIACSWRASPTRSTTRSSRAAWLCPTGRSRAAPNDLDLDRSHHRPGSELIGTTASDYGLFERTSLNLLAVSRRDKRFTERLSHIPLEAGDVVLVQGPRRSCRRAAAPARSAAARRAPAQARRRAPPLAAARSSSPRRWP